MAELNAAIELLDHNLAAGRAEKVAYTDMQRELTFGELSENCTRMGELLAAHGVAQESRIAVLMLDTVDWPTVFLGAIRVGVIPVALNTLLTTEQYDYILNDCRAQALFISAPLLPVVTPILENLPHLRHVFVVGESKHDHIDFTTALQATGTDAAPATTYADEVAFWLYSSGSTGMPKGVQHVHSSMTQVSDFYGQQLLGIREDDVSYSAAKFFFAYGLANNLYLPLSVGATTVLFDGRPTPEAVMERLATHQPTLFYGVPTLYAALLSVPECTPENTSHRLRLCISAGEALPPDIAQQWTERFGVEVLDGVGSTELLYIFVSNRPGDVRFGTSGKAVPGYEIKLIGEDGTEVPDGEVGEMVVRTTTASIGYWNQRAKSRSTFVGEWTHTGDKYIRNTDGYYEICGRTDDMFKVSGIWVSPFEVEAALISHPAVLEAGVVPAEDEDELVKPKAFVVLQPGQSSDGLFEALKSHVQNAVGVWKYPRWIEFVDDLPKTATGKIQRYKLRES